jgi:hypothetical protein
MTDELFLDESKLKKGGGEWDIEIIGIKTNYYKEGKILC